MTEAKIKTPVTIFTNGKGCKWINDADGEAVEFVTVANALNRQSELEAEVKRRDEILRFAGIELLPDGDYQYKPKQVKALVGAKTQERIEQLEAEVKVLREADNGVLHPLNIIYVLLSCRAEIEALSDANSENATIIIKGINGILSGYDERNQALAAADTARGDDDGK